MQDLDYIDHYFKGALPPDETGRFEQRIVSDPPFAEEVSFYCMAMQAAREQRAVVKKQHFREIYKAYDPALYRAAPTLVRRLLPFAALAAVLAALLLGWFLLMKPASPRQLADAYTQQHFIPLGIKMSSAEDSLQTGLRWYNEGKLKEARQQFENIISHDGSDIEAKKYAGIVCLRMGEFDKALEYFGQLEQYPRLYSNPGKFLHALTLMKRSMPGDQQKAKELLQQVVQNNLEGKETAQQWLRNW